MILSSNAIHSEQIALDFLRERGYFVDILWHANDIKTLCEDHGWLMPDTEECQRIFGLFREEYDGENGLSWPRLETIVRRYMLTRKTQSLAARLRQQLLTRPARQAH